MDQYHALLNTAHTIFEENKKTLIIMSQRQMVYKLFNEIHPCGILPKSRLVLPRLFDPPNKLTNYI